MSQLDKLLQQAGLTEVQEAEIRRFFAESSGFTGIAHVDIEPTLRRSLIATDASASASEGEVQEAHDSQVSKAQPTLGRYVDLGLLGTGGMGEVRRVLDPELNRRLAMKIVHPRLLSVDAALGRFIDEAQVVAQLQHPNIIPIHEIGRLEDGRLYFTMKEVQGRPLSEIIADVHAASTDMAWQPTSDGWTFRRLVDVLVQVCAATAFAHSKGVVHRDLKPENILVGQFDEVLLVDWGIAKIIASLQEATEESEGQVQTYRSSADMTRMGEVAGTPAYMAPEQARGQVDKIDGRTDIYALGAILYEILSGRCPYGGSSSKQVLSQVILGPPPSVRTTIMSTERVTGTIELDFFDDVDDDDLVDVSAGLDEHNEQGLKLPEDLVEACERAMQRRPADRYQYTEAFKKVLSDWLDGAKKRDKALEIVESTHELTQQADALGEKAKGLSEKAAEMQDGRPSWEFSDAISGAWAMEDEAATLRRRAGLLAARREQALKGALTHVADLAEVHAELVSEYRRRHHIAEASQQTQNMEQARLGMEFHAEHLPSEHPVRTEVEQYLEGLGKLSVDADVPGAKVYVAKYEVENRRLVVSEESFLGETPLVEVPMSMGSYRLRLSHPGHHDVIYPVQIDRQGHWRGITPEGDCPTIHLPLEDAVAANECFVPAGPYLCGGDPATPEGLPAAKVWVDDFIVQRFQVTYGEYQGYLQSLHDAGRTEAFQTALPVHEAAGAGTTGASCFVLDEAGVVKLVEDPMGRLPSVDWPIAFVSFRQAVAYASWLAESTGQKWRILNEFEWEKAARGVDGRAFPWGNTFAPTWCNMEMSQPEKGPVDVDSFPVDCSVYGVRGMAGNLSQWTSTDWKSGVSLKDYQRVPEQTPADQDGVYRVFRGGGWMLPDVVSRTGNRVGFDDTDGVAHVGFRVGRSLK